MGFRYHDGQDGAGVGGASWPRSSAARSQAPRPPSRMRIAGIRPGWHRCGRAANRLGCASDVGDRGHHLPLIVVPVQHHGHILRSETRCAASRRDPIRHAHNSRVTRLAALRTPTPARAGDGTQPGRSPARGQDPREIQPPSAVSQSESSTMRVDPSLRARDRLSKFMVPMDTHCPSTTNGFACRVVS